MIDWQKYGLHSEPGTAWSIDARHAEWIKAALLALKPSSVVEVGCHLGVSTLAVLEAGVADVHLVDIKISDSVRRMAADYGAQVHEERSEEALARMGDMSDGVIVVDGDHSLPVVMEEAKLIARMSPRAIVAHDVTAELIGLGCPGPMWLWHALQSSGWLVFVDCLPRAGERTSRGTMIATRNISDYASVVSAYAQVHA